MKTGWIGLLLVLPTVAHGCAPQAPSAQPSAASRSGLVCPAVQNSREMSGVVRDVGGEAIPNAVVIVVNTWCGALTDSLGRWVLAGAPVDSLILQSSFIGYRRTQMSLSASKNDSSGILISLGRAGEPDSYLPGPIPEAELHGMLEAVIAFYGPRTAVAGDELEQVAAMTGSPAPSRSPAGPTVVLDSAGKSGWNQIPTEWLAEWLADSSIAAMCSSWRTPACRGLGLTSFLRLPTLPRRTAPDTAYVTPWVSVLSVVDCEKDQSMGHMSEELLILIRSGAHWSAQRSPGGLELQGTVMCDPNWKGEP